MKKLILHIILLVLGFAFWVNASAQDEDIIISDNTVWEVAIYTYNNILVTNGATLTLNGAVTIHAQNLTIDSNSSISADNKGYPAGEGPGAGTWLGGGGSYGGKGGSTSGPTYGSAKFPTDLGSGGGNDYGNLYGGYGVAGAGAIRLNIADTLTLNGTISANGESTLGSGGGGSGGSIYITTSTFSGTGQVSANGGNSGSIQRRQRQRWQIIQYFCHRQRQSG